MPSTRMTALALLAALVTAAVPTSARAAEPSATGREHRAQPVSRDHLAQPGQPGQPGHPGQPGGPAHPVRPEHPVLSGHSSASQRAFDAVRSAFEEDDGTVGRPDVRGKELTTELLQLRLGLDRLSPEDQAVARAYLARPTDGTEYYGANYGPNAHPTNDCDVAPTEGSHVCVHWARRSPDAPRKADKDGDGLPNQVERTRDVMNLVWGREVEAGGYRPPLPDNKGPDQKLDVYLVDIGDDGLYGYCGSENVKEGRSAAAYCVLDNDYAHRQFPDHTPLENLEVTAAHEFFHAVQFGYDVREDPWLMESTATWIEDEIFDDVNDNRLYLPVSSMRVPQRPLDSSAGTFLYGNWIWWRYLTERFPQDKGTGLPVLVKRVWELADDSQNDGTYSVDALAQALVERQRDLGHVFAEYSSANRMPVDPSTGIYSEGEAYPKAPLAKKYLFTTDRLSVDEKTVSLPHLSSATVAFKPQEGYDVPGWSLTVDVDLPNTGHEPFAQVTLVRVDGTVTREFVGLTSNGEGSLEVPFDSTTVKRVELTLTDADHSYECNQSTLWSCNGRPDKKRKFHYSAAAML